MAKKKELTPEELELQADAFLAAADAAEAEGKASKKSGKKAAEAAEAPRVMTDEEAKKAGIVRLDDKQVAVVCDIDDTLIRHTGFCSHGSAETIPHGSKASGSK